MPSQRVLICGAGVSGSILAFWLAKHDFEVVVIERSRAEQKAGQGLEIEEPALQVVEAMGIMDKLEAIKTGELGFNVMDEQSRSWALFGVGRMSITGALEVMRGDLTEVLYKAADESPNVTYHFETAIQSLRQTSDKVIVDFENRKTKATTSAEFDFVVGADGARSRTRQLIMRAAEQRNYLKPVGAYVAYFSIPKQKQDWPYSRLCQFTNSRVVWTRPVAKDSDTTSVYLIHINDDIPALRQANAAGDRTKQKEAFAELYSGLGWETPRIVESMLKSENFYSDELVQVKLPTWSKDRVVLLGDSAWAPTPFTGEGNQLAIIGAWVLAQELSRHRSVVAFHTYEKRLRQYVENAQSIPLWGYAPKIVVPKSAVGIWAVRRFVMVLGWVVKFVEWLDLKKGGGDKKAGGSHESFDLQM